MAEGEVRVVAACVAPIEKMCEDRACGYSSEVVLRVQFLWGDMYSNTYTTAELMLCVL